MKNSNLLKTGLQIILVVIITTQTSYSQSIPEIDTKLAALLDKIAYWDNDTTGKRDDSLEKANDRISAYIQKVGSKNSSTLSAAFPKAARGPLSVISSDDNKIRLYSWDTRMGGSMRLYYDLIQYMTDNGVKVKDMRDPKAEEDYGCDYNGIFTIHTAGNKTIYLVCGYAIESTKDRHEAVEAYTIDGSVFKKFDLFKTKTKSLNTIGYGYDQFASMGDDHQKDLPTIHLSKDFKNLYIPIVNGEILTDKYLVYVFDGNNYVFDKNAK
jgi:hypothetical protein